MDRITLAPPFQVIHKVTHKVDTRQLGRVTTQDMGIADLRVLPTISHRDSDPILGLAPSGQDRPLLNKPITPTRTLMVVSGVTHMAKSTPIRKRYTPILWNRTPMAPT